MKVNEKVILELIALATAAVIAGKEIILTKLNNDKELELARITAANKAVPAAQ